MERASGHNEPAESPKKLKIIPLRMACTALATTSISVVAPTPKWTMAITRGKTARSAKDDVTADAPKTEPEAEAEAEAEPEGSGRQSRRDKVEKPQKKRRRKLSKGRAGELQFITITEPEEIRNQQNQSALRRHVMKKVLRDRDSRRSTPGSDVGETFNSNLMLGPAYSSAFTQNHHATSGNLAHWLVTEWQPSPQPLIPGSASPLYGASYYVKPEHHELMAYCKSLSTHRTKVER